MEFNVGKVGINLGGWYGIFLGDKGSLSVYNINEVYVTGRSGERYEWRSRNMDRNKRLDALSATVGEMNIHYVEFHFVSKSAFCRLILRRQCGQDLIITIRGQCVEARKASKIETRQSVIEAVVAAHWLAATKYVKCHLNKIHVRYAFRSLRQSALLRYLLTCSTLLLKSPYIRTNVETNQIYYTDTMQECNTTVTT